MEKSEIETRITVAVEILENIHRTMCNEPTKVYTRQQTYEFCDIIQRIRSFVSQLEKGV